MVTLCPLTLPASFCASSLACRLLASSWTRRLSKSSSVRFVARSALPWGIRKLRAKPGLTFTTSPIWPSFGTRSRRMTCMAAMASLPGSAGDVGQEGQLAGALDSLRQLPLLLRRHRGDAPRDRKSTRLNSSHPSISYAVFCLKKKNKQTRVSYQVQRNIKARPNDETSTRAVRSTPHYVTCQKIEIIFC